MGFHHVEIWVDDFAEDWPRWGWLLAELGWRPLDAWSGGQSWQSPDGGYLVVEQSRDLQRDVPYDRMRAGLNHLAFWAPNCAAVDRLVERAPGHGWTLLFPDRHPYAGGEHHYAAYLESGDGFEVEVVARD
ncbi:MAG: glyoxalase [Propionibacteriales bacterium]|nr:glyoxalase [Propionibacteriales bacterium]